MKNNNTRFSIIGFFLFFFTIFITSTTSIFVYYLSSKSTNGNVFLVGLSVFATILIGALLCTLCDIIRRKEMVEKPVKLILDATQKIATGNFNVKLTPFHEFNKYDEYDKIFENINIMTAELSKNELLKSDFISNVSHEIKTPLTIIQNYAKTLQTRISSKQKKECLDGLVIQTKRLSDLISNILKLNKLESQETLPEMEQFDLSELLRISTLDFETLFEKKNLELVCDIDEMKIINSSSLLEIVFKNLISNAIKFTDENGKITISLKAMGDYAVIKVQDTGCGISNETGKRIFDKFYQGDTSHSAEGNGLGLALVKKVIDLIGGEISVESKVGVGSSFIIKLKKGKLA